LCGWHESFPNDDLLTCDAQYFDCSSAAKPIQQGIIPPVPYRTFSPSFFEAGPTRVQPLDVSEEPGIVGPATSPALCANFIRIVRGSVMTSVEATSQVFFVFRGNGRTDACGETIHWSQGDYMVLPAHGHALHHSDGEAGLYWVHDAPLLRYLGASPTVARFKPTFYQHSKAQQKLAEIATDPGRRIAHLPADAGDHVQPSRTRSYRAYFADAVGVKFLSGGRPAGAVCGARIGRQR